MGIDVLCEPGWSARGAAVFAGGDEVFDCGAGALWVDAGAERESVERARMGVGIGGCVFDFCGGLRIGFLGGAAGGFGVDGGDAGDDSGGHGPWRDFFFGDATAYGAPGGGTVDRLGRGGRGGGALAGSWGGCD